MVNVSASIFSLSVEKTAKKGGYLKKQILAHTLPKEMHGGGRDEKGVSKYFLLVGVDVNFAPGWSENKVPALRQFTTVRTTVRQLPLPKSSL